MHKSVKFNVRITQTICQEIQGRQGGDTESTPVHERRTICIQFMEIRRREESLKIVINTMFVSSWQAA